jgi:hypothetical protein
LGCHSGEFVLDFCPGDEFLIGKFLSFAKIGIGEAL